MGAWACCCAGRDRYAHAAARDGRRGRSTRGARTAIVMPICNEHVPTVFARPARDLRFAGARPASSEHFDFFVLSDTTEPDIARRRAGAPGASSRPRSAEQRRRERRPRVHYRWRQHRIKRKAGNVADFCRRWGARLPLHGRARRRQRHDRRLPDDAGAADGGASRRRHHPDRAARRRPRDAARPRPAVRARASTGRCSPPACTSGSSANRTTGATTRSCAWRRSCDHCALAPLPGRGPLVGRHHVARLRRGRADAPRRLEGLDRRRPRRQLRAGAAEPARRAAARPPLVPRQPAELAPDVRAAACTRCIAPCS